MTDTRQAAPIRLGIIGLGGIAQIAHLPALATLGGLFQIRHLCDLSSGLLAAVSARLPEEPRCSTRAEEVLADPEVDAVLILTPSAHGPETLAAVTAGKHVFAEKPLCITVAELDEIERAAAAAGRVVQVGYMKTHEPMVEAAKRRLLDLEDPRLIRVTVLHPDETPQQSHHNLLRFDDVTHGQLEPMLRFERATTRDAIGDLPESFNQLYRDLALGSLVHQASLVRYILGRPLGPVTRISAWPFGSEAPYGAPPSLSLDAELGGDMRFRMDWLWVPGYPEYFEEVEVFGVAGSLRLRLPPPYVPGARAQLWEVQADGTGQQIRELRTSDRHPAFRRQLQHFHRAVREAIPTNLTGVRDDLRFLQDMVAWLTLDHGLTPGGEAAQLTADANSVSAGVLRIP